MFEIQKAESLVLKQIEQNILYDFYRIVDVDTYTVYDLRVGELIPQEERCYVIWKRGSACQNCISSLSTSETRQIVKMETLDGHVYLIVSMPFPALGGNMALELIKDVSDSLLISDQEKNVGFAELIQQMNDMATRDPYTGLFNKRYTEQELCKAALEWDESNPFAIAVLDIDRFKTVNDTYGHQEGDNVILSIATLLQTYAEKGNGWASRLGGDEFLILHRGMNQKEAVRMTESLCWELAETVFGSDGKEFHVSLSMGAAEYGPGTEGWRMLVKQADQAMYLHKQRLQPEPRA